MTLPWLTLSEEFLILLLIGVIMAVMEASYTNLTDGLKDVWNLSFPKELFSAPVENILKTGMFVIVFIRGVTIHFYIGSYLLMVLPLAKRKLRTLLYLWLAFSGFRSIIVNMFATFIGLFICASLPEAHPACFTFAGIKGLELACSLFMWIIVNDYLNYLGNTKVLKECGYHEDIRCGIRAPMAGLDEVDMGDYSDSDSESELLTALTETIKKISKNQKNNYVSISEDSQRIAEEAVINFFENALHIKFSFDLSDQPDEWTEQFLMFHRVDINKFVEKIRNYIDSKIIGSERKCIHRPCLQCTPGWKNFIKQFFIKNGNLIYYPTVSFSHDIHRRFGEVNSQSELEEDEIGEVMSVLSKIFSEDQLNNNSTTYLSRTEINNNAKNSNTSSNITNEVNNTTAINGNISLNSSNDNSQTSSLSTEIHVRVNSVVQTDPLSRELLHEIERQEKLNSILHTWTV